MNSSSNTAASLIHETTNRLLEQLGGPTSPAEILSDILRSNGKTQKQLANALNVSLLSVNQLINGRRSITAPMALKLSKAIGGKSPEFWMMLQNAVDLFEAKRSLTDIDSVSELVPEAVIRELAD